MSIPRTLSIAFVLATALSALSSGQDASDFSKGIIPYNSYSSFDFDTINLSNGNLGISIPLISYPQRGGVLKPGFALQYTGISWADIQVYGEYGYEYSYWQPTYYSGVPVGLGVAMTGLSSMEVYAATYGEQYYIGYGVVDSTGAHHPMANTSATTYESIDASGYRWDLANRIMTEPNGVQHLAAMDSNGIYDESVIKDANGNAITISSLNYTIVDTLNRSLPFPGFDRSTYSSGCSFTNYPGQGTSTVQIKICASPVNIHTNFQVPGVPEYSTVVDLISSATLPNGMSWNFTYNSYGDLQTVTTPTGTTVSYGWVSTNDFYNPTTIDRTVNSRSVDLHDGTGPHTWQYSWQGTMGGTASTPLTQNVVVTDPVGNDTVHTLSNLERSDFPEYEVSTAYYNGSYTNGSLIKSTSAQYSVSATETPMAYLTGALDGYNVVKTSDSVSYPTPSGQNITSTSTYSYDSGATFYDINDVTHAVYPLVYGKVIQEQDYDFGNNAAGSLLRATNTSYAWQSNASYLTANLLNTPCLITVYGAGTVPQQGSCAPASAQANQVSQISVAYDESNGSPQGAYGNPTSTTRWLNTGGQVSTSTVYNTQGLPVVQYDGNHNPAVMTSYQCSGAFPYQVTDALMHMTTYGYDCSTGLVTSIQGPNDLAAGRPGTQFSYTVMNDLSGVTYPDGGQTTINYGGYALPLTVTATTVATPNPSITSTVVYDGLARPTFSTDANGYTTNTVYDPLDRTLSVSNPYSGTPSDATGITSFAYDAVGRVVRQCQQDNGNNSPCQPGSSYLQWTYSGNTTTFSDEARNSWSSTYDALGRLTSVTEPNSAGTLYVYDPLGNLRSVTQNGLSGESARSRSFSYDSLSRLITSTNPETGTICYGTWSGGSPGSGTCQGGYDLNGNLLAKTDANGTTIGYTYDALNRPIAKSGGYDTAAIFTYDQGTNGIGRLTSEFEPSASGTQFTYDAMGRVSGTSWYDYVASSAAGSYVWKTGMGVQYDLAGNVSQLTYPDGRVVTQSMDGAGRLASVTDATPNAPATAYFSGAQYWPSGALMNSTFGDGVTQSFLLNSRLQPCRSMASTPLLAANAGGGNLFDHSLYHNINGYRSTGLINCGNEFQNNGNIMSIVDNLHPILTQGFMYDSLNRLTYASRGDGTYNQNYNYDSFGNMILQDNLHANLAMSIDPATNRLLQNVSDLQYFPNGELASSPGNVYMYTDEGYLRCINNCWNGSYLYNSLGERTLDDTPIWPYREDVYLNGEPMAELDSNGNWTDYIYANGAKIAKVASSQPLLHTHGDRSGGGVCLSCGTGWNVNIGVGITIGAGDRLAFDQLQVGSYSGMAIAFSNVSTFALLETDTAGQPLYESHDSSGTWQHRVFDMSDQAGNTIENIAVGTGSDVPAVVWDTYYANMVILHADGSVSPIFTGQATSGIQWGFGSANATLSTDLTPTSDPAVSTKYYLADHLGTTQMELASGGWPVWSGSFTPFGQEIVNGTTTNYIGTQPADGTDMHYKFTGKERDAESGLDYFGARYYGSNMGRWLSPDDIAYVNIANPQSLNLYSYVQNSPVTSIDPDGHFGFDLNGINADPCWDETCSEPEGYSGESGGALPTGTCLLGFLTGNCGSGSDNGYGDDPWEGIEGGGGGVAHGGGGAITSTPSGPQQRIAPNNGTPGNQVSPACQAQLLNMINAEHGTNLTSANITDFYNNGTAANIIVDASGLTAAQFNSFQPGRYSTYGGQFLLGFGMAGHIANEPGVNAGAVFSNSNIGGNLSVHFAFHDDHGYANNPFGALIHFFTDVLGHNSRKPC